MKQYIMQIAIVVVYTLIITALRIVLKRLGNGSNNDKTNTVFEAECSFRIKFTRKR